ncbi:hypothetical protein [Bradyrhizobium japonicum]|uniref:hypothetical protein n=1 Tax=Bradyrhizobium japonicum TaxID=375 RepID=UPI0003FBAE5A|nr:hypothetical protein [Bradyrhizobium japonicum]
MFKVLDWFRSHPVLIGPALLLTSIAAILYLFIDPITVLFVAIIFLTAGFAALVDPKTYFRKGPTGTQQRE